ncbi:putative fatty acyl CoA synthetase 2 [Trypanosoma theileri]|uniref:Putative fatty acyl CoA synthetase 2 n=1 Tax=Trypanosoma theileri TaxID=67003 RepID=A0A1X0P2W9_9TRYP|nr:putative fatty acyl CoA synthetase 2 [Trypanosoma theileri]ORC91201.1 putative fatty acyl CoA synthetase 2 [Trypanosoma theileri]
MGSALSTLMDLRNSMSMVPHPFISGDRSPQSLVVPGTETETTSGVYRHSKVYHEEDYQKLVKEYHSGMNCVQILEKQHRELTTRPAVAYRPLEKVEHRPVDTSDGKHRMFDYFHYGERKVLTYGDLWRQITLFGAGLREIGLPEKSMITIYEETRWEWLVCIYGIWTQNMIASTVYVNLGEDALTYALSETSSAAIFCSANTMHTLLPLLRAQNLSPTIIYVDNLPNDVDLEGFQVIGWNELLERGEKSNYTATVPTDNNADALVMYTSGTTGNPKGVVHTHGSLASGIVALDQRLSDIYTGNGVEDVYCAYLPLAHILEFGIVNIFLKRGSLVGFCNPRTLTDEYAIPHGDFKEFRPRIVIGVPRVFDTIKKGVAAKLPQPGTLKRKIFDKAYATRLRALQKYQDTPYWNKAVFKMCFEAIGGRAYSMLSGGGPLSAETQTFMDVCFGGPMLIQGWGLTETVCCGTTQRLNYIEVNDVGQPVVTAELKLLDTAEYKHTDKPEPRGEILLRGPFLFKGYYKQEALTREAIDEDGWFHTGDVGSMSSNGTLRLIGRVKALAKNVLGEYIALETLEAIYSQHDVCITGGVCVLVDPARAYITALVLTEPPRALKFAEANGIKGSYEELLQNEVFHAKVAEALAAIAKKAGRKPFELVRYVRVLGDTWTPENGLVTPTSKLRRSNIDKHYADIIKELFAPEK